MFTVKNDALQLWWRSMSIISFMLSFSAMAQEEAKVSKEEVIQAIEKTLEIAEKEFENGSYTICDDLVENSDPNLKKRTFTVTWNSGKHRSDWVAPKKKSFFCDGEYYYQEKNTMQYEKTRTNERGINSLKYFSYLKELDSVHFWWVNFPNSHFFPVPEDSPQLGQTIRLVADSNSNRYTYYLDSKFPYCLLKSEIENEGKKLDENFYSDFQKVCEGVHLPMKVTNSYRGKINRIRTYEEITYGVVMPDSFFSRLTTLKFWIVHYKTVMYMNAPRICSITGAILSGEDFRQ